MQPMPPCRVIVDEPASGVWNMAVDEALLDSAAAGGPPTLRIYRWSEPTLSLGYFQRFSDRDSHTASLGLPVVRRSSGGGALVHDHELTYSLALPPGDPRGRNAVALACLVHQALIAAIDALAPRAARLQTFRDEVDAKPVASREPFLCFQRRSQGDVVAPDGAGKMHKLCGSAQRRRHCALLQHGGVLLSQSTAAPELPGLKQLLEEAIPIGQLHESWVANVLNRMDLRPEIGPLEPPERNAAEQLAEAKFAAAAWTARR